MAPQWLLVYVVFVGSRGGSTGGATVGATVVSVDLAAMIKDERSGKIKVGPNSVYNEDENPDGVWTTVGSPDCFRAENDSAVGLLIDALKFSGMPFSEADDPDI